MGSTEVRVGPERDVPRLSLGATSVLLGSTRVLLALATLALMVATPHFFRAGTLSTILSLASILGVMAVGQSFVLIGGGFDLSQGAILAFSGAVVAWLSVEYGLNAWLLGAAGVTLGALLGSINGFFVSVVRTNPFVTTLSTLLIFRGAVFVFLGGIPISGVTAFSALDRSLVLGDYVVPTRGLVFFAVTGFAWFLLKKMVVGRHLYATGGNIEAARFAGLRTRLLKTMTFVASGAAAGLAAVLLLSWVRVAKADTGTGMELESIAACVVGGVSLQGGRGSVLGAAAGCLLLQALGTWITIRGFQDEYRSLITGAIILTFAAVDALMHKRQ